MCLIHKHARLCPDTVPRASTFSSTDTQAQSCRAWSGTHPLPNDWKDTPWPLWRSTAGLSVPLCVVRSESSSHRPKGRGVELPGCPVAEKGQELPSLSPEPRATYLGRSTCPLPQHALSWGRKPTAPGPLGLSMPLPPSPASPPHHLFSPVTHFPAHWIGRCHQPGPHPDATCLCPFLQLPWASARTHARSAVG